jgi:hypothetical protein
MYLYLLFSLISSESRILENTFTVNCIFRTVAVLRFIIPEIGREGGEYGIQTFCNFVDSRQVLFFKSHTFSANTNTHSPPEKSDESVCS